MTESRRSDPGRGGADGRFPPAGALPEPGTVMRPLGTRHFTRDLIRCSWMIAVRAADGADEVRVAGRAGRAAGAARSFQRSRMEDCGPGEVVEAYLAVLGGWRLVDRAPMLHSNRAEQGDPVKELVLGPTGDPLGLVWPQRPGAWWRMAALPGEPGHFELPRSMRQAVFSTRLEAIDATLAAAGRGAGDQWAQAWSDPMRRARRAGIGTQVELAVRMLGPSGVWCSMPGCGREARFLMIRTGDDVGRDARLGCAEHCGEAFARQASAASGE